MAIGTHLFLLANGLSVAGAPYPRERFLAFGLLGGMIGLLTGVPAAMILAVSAVAADARATHEKNEVGRRAAEAAAGWMPPPPTYYYGYPPRDWRGR